MEPAIRDRIYAFLLAQGLRRTHQRDAIIEAAFGTAEHYTAEQLLSMARGIDPSVSRATVYRTLPLLVECGVLKEMDFGQEQKVYDPNYIQHPHHNHLICVDCSKIVEFEDEHIELLENCISKRLGFSPSSKSLRIEARCDELKRYGACSKKPSRRPSPAASRHEGELARPPAPPRSPAAALIPRAGPSRAARAPRSARTRTAARPAP